jgi:hypothetical protein
MSRYLPIIGAAVLLLAYGLAEGYWTNRWSLPPQLAEAPERLAAIPRQVGEWQGEDAELDPRQIKQGNIHAALLRRYTSRVTGETLSVLIVCGRPGPITVHSPEVCLGGAGFELEQPEKLKEITGPGLSGDDTFWAGRFHKPGAAVPEVMELHWSWNARGDWQAVEGARLYFARERALFKLYVTRALTRPDGPGAEKAEGGDERNPSREFLAAFLPEVRRALSLSE